MNIYFMQTWCMQELFEVESQRREKLSSKLEVAREHTDHYRYCLIVQLLLINKRLIWLIVVIFC